MTTQIEHTNTTAPASRRAGGRALGFAAGVAFTAVVSAAVGAGAATLVTSARIKDDTIVGRDVKDGGLTGADLRAGSVGGNQVKDGSIASADVRDGSIGTADLAPSVAVEMVNGLIPSGTTVTGIESFNTSSDVSSDYTVTISLPGRARSPLSPEIVNFGGADVRFLDSSASCTGDATTPTAPAGMVCIYLISATTDADLFFGSNVAEINTDRAFSFLWADDATHGSDVYANVAWAYTAP